MRWTAPLLFLLLTAASPSPDVDTIVQRHIDAIGGAARWRNVQSMLVQGSNNYANFVWMWKSPDRTRTDEQEKQEAARTLVTSFDGTTAWMENPFSGPPKPRRLTPVERRHWETGVAIRSDLLELPAKGATLKLLGEEPLDGRRTYKLSLVRPGRDEVLLWIDAQSYLLLQRSRNVIAPWGGTQAATTRLSDYRNVQGVLVAHKIGGTNCLVEVNPELDDDAFRPPQPLP